MIILFQLIVLTSLWVLATEISTQEGMIFYRLRQHADSKMGLWGEVLISCVWCKPSLHSIIGFLAAFGLGVIKLDSLSTLILYPFVVAGSSITCGLIWSIYKLIEVKTLYYNHKEQNEYFNLKNRKIDYFKNKKD